MQGDSIHTSWRFVNYYFVLEPFSSLFGQRCEFLWETLHFCVRGWQRDCSSAGTLARAVALSHVLVPQPLKGRWQMERVPWPCCCSASTLWFLTGSSAAGRAAGCTNHCAHLCFKDQDLSLCFPFPFLLFTVHLPARVGQKELPWNSRVFTSETNFT